MRYLIHGVFFEMRIQSEVVREGSELRTVLRDHEVFYEYASGFGPDSENPNVIVGRITDRHGNSALTDFVFGENELSFVKRYDCREEPIRHVLSKQSDGTWKGELSGRVFGICETHCVITPVPDDFFVSNAENRRDIQYSRMVSRELTDH